MDGTVAQGRSTSKLDRLLRGQLQQAPQQEVDSWPSLTSPSSWKLWGTWMRLVLARPGLDHVRPEEGWWSLGDWLRTNMDSLLLPNHQAQKGQGPGMPGVVGAAGVLWRGYLPEVNQFPCFLPSTKIC